MHQLDSTAISTYAGARVGELRTLRRGKKLHVGQQKFNDTIEVFGAKSVRGTGHCYFMVVLPGLLLLSALLMNPLRVDDGACGSEDSKVSSEHVTGRLSERLSVDTNLSELTR
jgi:hypothetical protein